MLNISGYSFSVGDLVDTVYRYNPGPNSWNTRHPYRCQLSRILLCIPPTNKIYVFGGQDVAGDNFNNTQIYNIAEQHLVGWR